MKRVKELFKSSVRYLSQVKVLRRTFSLLDDYYEGTFNHDKTRMARFFGRAVQMERTFTFWRFAPSKYRGGLILNVLGLHVLRCLWYNVRYLLRPAPEAPAAVESDGCAVLPRFLSAEQVAELRRFYASNAEQVKAHFDDFSELLIADNRGVAQDRPDFREIFEKIGAWTHYQKLGEQLIRKRLRVTPAISIIRSRSELGDAKQADGQDTPHTDVFYPSFKMFIYLSDVAVDDAPFTYFPGSHRFTWRYLRSAYAASVDYYWMDMPNRIEPQNQMQFLLDRDYPRTPLTGDAGSAILFNVQGLHCRGTFKKDVPRERLVLLIDFRQAECVIQGLAA